MTRWLSAVLVFGCGVSLLSAADADGSKLTVKEGDKAPEIACPATSVATVLPDAKDAKTLDLKAFRGKKNVVLFFYPRALTGGCTTESCGFRDLLDKFQKADTVVIGISTDTVEKQQEFTDKHGFKYPLLADYEMKVSKALGVMRDAKVTKRITFVIDKDGVIRKIYGDVKPNAHPAEVLKFVETELSKK